MMDCIFEDSLSLEEEVKYLRAELIRKDDEISRLKALVSTDALTGISNRFFLDNSAQQILTERRETAPTWGVLMLDIDFFKKFNDRYGHMFGDMVLKQVAQMLKEVSRRGDVVIRYGGEEFCVIVSGVSTEALTRVAERYRKAIEALKICCKMTGKCVSVTVSVGACFVPSDSDATLEEIIDYADKALYKAKDAGRNCSVVFERRKSQNCMVTPERRKKYQRQLEK